MKRVRAIAFVFVLLAIPATSQQSTQQPGESKCALKLAQSISIRGIHLGMSADELFALFPGAPENPQIKGTLQMANEPPQFGAVYLSLYPRDYSTREKFAGIDGISISLFDNRLVQYTIAYEGRPKGTLWNSVDDWIVKLSETLGLPGLADWKSIDGVSSGRKILQCDNAQILADISGQSGKIAIFLENTNRQRAEREKAYQEKKRREFKP